MKRNLQTIMKVVFVILGVIATQFYAVGQTNIAPLATASGAPACNSGACSTLNDLNFGTCGSQQMWLTSGATNPGSAVNVTFVWPSAQAIKGITVHAGESGSRFLGGGTIEYWNGSTWIAHKAFTQATGVCNYNVDFNPIVTTQLRIVDMVVTGSQQSNVNFREIEVWQGSLSNNDIGAVSVDSISNVCSTGAVPIAATVTNFGKNVITSFTVNWSINGALQVPVSWTGSLDTAGSTNPTSAQVVLGTHIFTASSNVIKVWTAQPNGLADTTRANDTAQVTRALGLSAGVYTIGGASPDYATFTDALTDLKVRGICGPVLFQVRAGTYNEQLDFDKVISGASLVNTITFEGVDKNTCILTRTASTDLTKRHTLLVSGSRYLTFRNLTIQGEGNISGHSSYTVIINGANTRYIGIKNCNIGIFGTDAAANTGTNYIAIVLGGSSSSYSSSAGMHNIEIDSNTITNGYFGLVHYGVAADKSMDNSFTHNVLNNQYYYGYFVTQYNNPKVEDNTFNLRMISTGITPIYISVANADTSRFVSIQRNRINGFGSYAMYLNNVSNDLGTKGFVLNNEIVNNLSTFGYGIYMGTCSRLMVHSNSVNMNMAGTTNAQYAGIYISGGTEKSLINNNLARTAPGLGFPLYIAAVGAVDTVNYNNYYKADTSNGLIYRGTTLYPATFRTSGTLDSNSYNNLPGFKTTTDLNVSNGCTQGMTLPLVTTDIKGNTRGTIPTVGAFEFAGLPNNMLVESVIAPASPIVLGFQDVIVRVKNVGTGIVNNFDVSYTNNGGTPVTQTVFATLNPCDTISVVFTGADQVNLLNVNNLKIYASNPNSLTDDDRSNDTLLAPFYSPLNGTYTIGATGADFSSINGAADIMKAAGVSGPVEFVINAGLYPEKVVINGPIPGLSDVNNVVFRGVSNSTVNIEADVTAGAVFMMNQVNYVTVRDVTVTNLSTAGSGIAVVGNTTSNAGTGCRVAGCIVNMPNHTTVTGSYGILVTGNASGGGTAAMRADSVQIDSNIVNKSGYAISVYGGSNASYNKFNCVRNNVCNQTYYMGAYIAYNYGGPTIVTDNVFDLNTAYGYYGLYYYYNQNADTVNSNIVSGNKVYNFGGYGIYAYYPAAGSPTAAPFLCFNNMVVGSATYTSSYGIYVRDLSASAGSRIYHNTAVTKFPTTSTTYGTLYTTGSANVIVKNNILVNYAGASPCYYAGTNPAAGNVNYNLYYNYANPNLVYRGGTFYTAATYDTTTAGGDSSFNEVPAFTSATNLSLSNACSPRGVDLTAIVPTDIDGTLRSINPMVGADEISAFMDDLELSVVSAPAVPMTLGLQDVVVLVKNTGSTSISSFNVSYRHNANAVKTMSYSGFLAPCDTVTMVFTGTDQINLINGANTIKVYVSAPNASADGNPLNDTTAMVLNPPLAGNYIVGAAPSNFVSIADATAALKDRGVAGPVVFRIKSGTYNEGIKLESAEGMSDSNTVTFTSDANDKNAVLWEYSSDIGTPTQPLEISGDYFNIKNLTLKQSGMYTGTRYVVKYTGTANFDTIDNCNILGPIYGVDGTSTGSYTIYGTGLNSNGLVISNNDIRGSHYGMYLYGNSSNYSIKNTTIINNTFDSTTYSAFYYLYYTTGTQLIKNLFTHRVMASNYTIGYQYHYYNDSGFVRDGNITNIIGGKSIYWYNYYSKNDTTNEARITNNVMDAGATGTLYYYLGGSVTNNLSVQHNSFRMGSGYLYMNMSGINNVRVYNNIITSNQAYSYYLTATPALLSVYKSDYNLISTTANITPIYAGGARTFAQVRSTGLYEQHSASYRAPFTDNTNLVPNVNDSAIWLVNGRGKDSTGVTVDILGVARPLTVVDGASDIGAYEVTPAVGVLAPLATVVPDSIYAGGTQSFLLGGDTVGAVTWDLSGTPPTSVGMRYYTGEAPALQGAQGAVTRAYWDFTTDGSAFPLYEIVLKNRTTLLNTVPSQTNSRSAYAAPTTWISNVGSASIVDSTLGNVITAGMSSVSARYSITDDANPIATFLTINKNPDDQAKCIGDSAYFIVDATGSSITYQWQSKVAGVWTNISGQTNDTLKVTGLNAGLNGTQYRCEIGSALGNANTNEATLTVGVATVITTQPMNATGCEGENVTFNAGVTGTNLSYQWQENIGGGFTDIVGATSASLVRSFIDATMNGYSYRNVVSGLCGSPTTASASLTVNSVISIGTQPTPASTSTCAGSSVMVRMAATGVQSFQWQINTGTGFFNIAGATDDTLNIASIPSEYDGGIIRCALVGACNITFSNTAVFNVQTPGKWMGTTSTAWATATNWGCSQLPTSASNIVIPATATNMPTLNAAVTINNLTIESGATLTLSTASAVLSATGNVVNNGTIVNTAGNLALTGTASQTLAAGTYNGKLTVNNAAGVVLAGALTVNDTLTFTSGKVSLGNYDLTMGNTGVINGANNTRYVVTNGTGTLTINNIGTGGRTGAVVFPVGYNGTLYNPATITNTGTADNFSVTAFQGAYSSYLNGAPVLSSAVTNNVIDVSWMINESVMGGSNATVQVEWTTAQELPGFTRTGCYVTRYDGVWNATAVGAAAGTNPYTKNMTGVTSFSPFTVGSNGTLPVSLVSFEAQAIGKNALLRWVTASEINNNHFVIERSFDGRNYTSVGKVAGNNNSNKRIAYEFVDRNVTAKGAVYYRLIQVDNNGTKNNSGVAVVTFNGTDAKVVVAPNPFTNDFKVILSDLESHVITVRDITGKVVATKSTSNMEVVTFDELGGLSSGVYFLNIDNDSTIKLIKM